MSRKGSRDVADHMAIQMDDSDSITVSEQSEPSAECWQNMYKLLNFYSLISDPTGILEKSSPENCLSGGNQLPAVTQFLISILYPTHVFPFSFTLHFYLLYFHSTHDFMKMLLCILIFLFLSSSPSAPSALPYKPCRYISILS